MKKSAIIIGSVVVVVIIVIVFVGSRFGGSVLTGSSGGGQEPSIAPSTGGAPSSTIPPGNTIVIGTKTGNVTTNNFYKSALGLVEENQLVLVQNEQYDIDYLRNDSSFTIVVHGSPVNKNRMDAETKLLSLLGVTQADACRLTVTVVVTGVGIYPPSFCH